MIDHKKRYQTPSFAPHVLNLYASKEDLFTMINTDIAIIGPIDASPTSPKLSSLDLWLDLTAAAPAPNARINGTVAEPVVIPPSQIWMARI